MLYKEKIRLISREKLISRALGNRLKWLGRFDKQFAEKQADFLSKKV